MKGHQEFSGITFDRDQLKKHHRCVQDDYTDRLISDQVMTLTWGQIFKMTFYGQTFDTSQEEKYDAGKLNAVSLLGQKLLQKICIAKNNYF